MSTKIRKLRRLFESDRNTVVIDGVLVDVDDNFNPTIDWVRKRLIELNTKYFNGKLDVTSFPIERYSRVDTLGGIAYDTGYDSYGNLINSKITGFVISTNYAGSERDFVNVLLHEMIHIFQIQILKKAVVLSVNGTVHLEFHDDNFTRKMNEFNSLGWEISIVKDIKDLKLKNTGVNTMEGYSVIFYIPNFYYDANTKKNKDNVLFQIIKNEEWVGADESLLREVASIIVTRGFRYSLTSYIKDNSSFTRGVENKDLLEENNRIIKQKFKELLNSEENYRDQGEILKKYILSKTITLCYSEFLNHMENKDFVLENSSLYTALPEAPQELKESKEEKEEEMLYVYRNLLGMDVHKVKILDDGTYHIEGFLT
jgi:hypothetical protein